MREREREICHAFLHVLMHSPHASTCRQSLTHNKRPATSAAWLVHAGRLQNAERWITQEPISESVPGGTKPFRACC